MEFAVKCHINVQTQIVCGPSPNLAAANCEDGGGLSWAPIAVCQDSNDDADEGGESTGTTGGYPWVPERHIVIDSGTGEYVIDADFVQSLKDDPNQLTRDDTVLRQIDSGHYRVAEPGALADALGWQGGDVLLAVDGHEIAGVEELSACGETPHDTSLGLSAAGFVAETCSGSTTAAFRLRASDENPGARSRDGFRHRLLCRGLRSPGRSRELRPDAEARRRGRDPALSGRVRAP